MAIGLIELAFEHRRGRTRLAHLYQSSPLRVLFPGADAMLVNTAGGLVGGDRHEIRVRVGAGAVARVGPQAAEKVYRSTGADAVVRTRLEAEGWLEYLPQETILFEGARLDRATELHVGGRALAGEILVFGRLARGEVMRRGFVRDEIRVHVDGRLVLADAFDGGADIGRRLDHRAGLAGNRATAMLVYVGPDAAEHLDFAREHGDATLAGGCLLMRWAAPDGAAIRPAYAKVWQGLRARAGGLDPVLPRLWHV